MFDKCFNFLNAMQTKPHGLIRERPQDRVLGLLACQFYIVTYLILEHHHQVSVKYNKLNQHHTWFKFTK